MKVLDNLDDYLRSRFSSGVHAIKPRVILGRIERLNLADHSLSLPFPPSTLGSIPVFDALILLAILKLVQPKRILEFGTFLGYSTRILLENSGMDCEVTSIDLPHGAVSGEVSLSVSETELHLNAASNDDYLRELQFQKGARYLSSLSPELRARLQLIKADSRTLGLDYLRERLGGSCDLIFIDGGHDLQTIASDTSLALDLASENATVIWHDYGSTIHQEVTEFVDRLARSRRIVTVSGSLIAMCHVGRDPLADSHSNRDDSN